MKKLITNVITKITMTIFVLALVLVSVSVCAKNLGKVGEVYPIKEQDIVEFIYARLDQMQKSGKLEKINEQMIAAAKKKAERPEAVKGITLTKKYRTWLVDPSITFDYDILDTEKRIIIKKGTTVNPFESVTLSKAYIFYNGDDKNQVSWIIKKDKRLQGKDKLVLINGSIIEQSKILKKRIYFDQHGRLSSKFGIKHTPAVVTQKGMFFKVEEMVP